MGSGILIGYYVKQDEARRALRELARNGYMRAALVHKGLDGEIHVADSFFWQRSLGVSFAACLSGGIGWIAALLLYWSQSYTVWNIPISLTLILIFSTCGALGAFFWLRRSRFCVDPGVVSSHSRWLVPGESVLILQTPVESMQQPVAMLRETGDPPPALFIMHPQREQRVERRIPAVNLSLAQIMEYARRLSGEQQVDPRPQHSTELLKRIKQSRHWVRHVCEDLTAASRLEQKATPAADWILDNEYILESTARDILLNLTRRFYRQLPLLASEPYRGMPCIYGLAKDLVTHSDLRLDSEIILAFIEAYQSVRSLTIGELWAIPQMLRFALIESIRSLAVTVLADLRERQLADLWANRLIAANRRDANQLMALLAELAKAEPSPSSYFGCQLVGLLYDEEAALLPVQSWLERTLKSPLYELNLREQNRQIREQLFCGNAFTSLRQLSLLDWREIFEQLSRVEHLLRLDPSGVYPGMDFATRDRCRRAIEELARGCTHSEEQVAAHVVKMATLAGSDEIIDERSRHVGAWLTGERRAELAKQLACHETCRYRLLEWIYRHHNSVYFSAIGILMVLLLFLAGAAGLTHSVGLTGITGLVLLLLIPVSQLAIESVNYLLTRLLPTRRLPKMDFEDTGIPDAYRTLVVVPMMLVNPETILAEVEKLEIRFLANKEANLLFSLFTDYTDSTEPTREDDSRLLETVRGRLVELNARYGGERFFLFHRERTWSDSEQKFIGWERKRGKLEELNRLIEGTRAENASPLVYLGNPDHLADIRFIITLDSDTQLPHGTARRMVETLAHPLNQPRFDANGMIMPGTYTIIQPRVSPTLCSTNASIFSRLFADAVGIDPYTQAVSDVYQDLSGEGSYHGKGIYDVRAFSRVLSGLFPEECILSHDLIEGAHVRVGLASDIELHDEFPQGYQNYSSRSHRWIRGDWQIAWWIFPLVPQAKGGLGANPLSLLCRWKILDNLRRSLLPVSSMVLLLLSWFLLPKAGGIIALVVVLQLLFHPLAQAFTSATIFEGFNFISLSKLWHDLRRAIADAALLPHQAAVALDAIVRVFYRRIFSHRSLLEWTAPVIHCSDFRRESLFVAILSFSSIASVMVGIAVWLLRPANLPLAAPWLLLWFFSPFLGWFLNLRSDIAQLVKTLSEPDRRILRQVARRTWRYFSSFVTLETSWLPPDNYQVAHQNRLAMRTSPTNIGLWMASVLGAHDNGYISTNQVIEKLTDTMATIRRLELFEGHLLNWYDIQTLAPLEPRYVSTVDSGNLLGALWTLAQGVEELQHGSLLEDKAFTGFNDTGALLIKSEVFDQPDGFDFVSLHACMKEWEAPPLCCIDKLRLLRRMQTTFRTSPDLGGVPSWAKELEDQVISWVKMADCYLTWIEILAEKSTEELAPLGNEALSAICQNLTHAPSLFALAHGHSESIRLLKTVRDNDSSLSAPLCLWLDRVFAAFATAKWLAGETLDMAEKLIDSIHKLSAGMGMSFLYDAKRKLFTIGFNVSTNRLDVSSYDLLASEARLGSFIAIARGDVPLEHWYSLGRPYGAVGRQRVLLSWTGTMFEYLMPLLFQNSYGNSLLDKAAREAVAVQIGYGRAQSVPWGISESAYADLDPEKTYQYKAFGVPSLGLKRGLEEQLVVAPYATFLALNVAPQETLNNLKHLEGLGLLGEYGFYEAMDFSRQSRREGRHGVVIEAYMAHHQGMSFLALTNFLHGSPFTRRFHSDPRVRAFESLLQERIPALPPLQLISTRQSETLLPSGEQVVSSGISFTTPHTATPRSLLLGNGHYGVMITNSGGGYSHWRGNELSRWRSDTTCDNYGIFCYIHESETDRVWSATYHPVGGKVKKYSVDFALDRAVFRREDHGIHTETEIFVSTEDDLEVRRISLINRSSRNRQLNLTSYVELSLAPHNSDRQHPAFNKLFIQTEAAPELQTLLAYRRQRSENESSIYVAHCFLLHDPDNVCEQGKGWQFETDRGRFIGRGRTLANPMGAHQDLGNNQGCVLDPSLSLRRCVTIKPGQRAQFSLIIAVGETREKVLMLMEKYRETHAIERAMDFAWNSAQQQLQVLRIQPEEARRFQQLASYLLFPSQLLRAPDERLEENRKGQSGLWPYAISGDLPIALITIGEARELGLVRQMLRAHNYWRMHGLSVDLVIINEEAGSYDRPLQEKLEHIIQAHSVSAGTDLAGGIYLKQAALIPETDLNLLKTAASVMLVAARGALSQQLGILAEVSELSEVLEQKLFTREASAPLPFMELNYFNSLGGFTLDGREYAIYLGPGTNTPAPWVNVIANHAFGVMISETGSGFTWYGNSQRNRLTGWSNDPVLDPASEAIFIRDEESAEYWTPTAQPIREELAYRARHGAGYTVFEHNSHGIEQELTVFVPVDEQGGKPIKLQRLRLLNASSRRRRLSVTYYVELTLGENRETSQMHVITNWDDETHAILARNRYHPEYGERVAFVAINPEADSYSGDRTAFIGRNRNLSQPVAMEQIALSKRTGAGLDPCAVLRVVVEIAPGERRDVICLLGQADTVVQARSLLLSYQEDLAFEQEFTRTKGWWDELLGTIEVHTPDLSADLLVNRWLQYQTLSCRIWGRSAFYQSGGAYGFRDQLQDVMAFLFVRPELAREQILRAAGRQFGEGDVQHWWHPPSGAGIRSRITDDLLWLPYLVAHYVRTTGDLDILQVEVPFLNAPLLTDSQHEYFSIPEVTFDQASVFEHCRRATGRGLTIGPHGLPLIGTGDWNDGMNLVGAGGKGESVWLGWFLCEVLQGMADLAKLTGHQQMSSAYRDDRSALMKRIETAGWDGEWYLRGTFDDGSLLGSSLNKEARIDSLPQTWAWLSGAADTERADQALESAWRNLVCKDEALVLLFAPPFDKADPSPGYIKGYPPGVRENGGQYTHAALWMAMAMVRKGDGERAVQLLRMLNPIEHTRDADAVWVYGVEPYVVAADVYRLPGRIGQGGWSWYTGSAAWMYRAWVEEVLGMQISSEELRINPVIPPSWPGFSIVYRHGEAIYSIQVENPQGFAQGVAWVEMDGRRLFGGVIPLEKGLVKHMILVQMGTSTQ